jgi:hypothetical protein
MPPILKRLRKLSEAKSPDLATLLEPYGSAGDENPAGPDGTPEPEPSAQDEGA